MTKVLTVFLVNLAAIVATAGEVVTPDISHACEKQARPAAIQLYKLHNSAEVEEGLDFYIDDKAKVVAPLKAPAGKRTYDVLEYWGTEGKMGQYRIRMIYAVLGTPTEPFCVLMGQEILDYSAF
jgi:hypothetical protein